MLHLSWHSVSGEWQRSQQQRKGFKGVDAGRCVASYAVVSPVLFFSFSSLLWSIVLLKTVLAFFLSLLFLLLFGGLLYCFLLFLSFPVAEWVFFFLGQLWLFFVVAPLYEQHRLSSRIRDDSTIEKATLLSYKHLFQCTSQTPHFLFSSIFFFKFSSRLQ